MKPSSPARPRKPGCDHIEKKEKGREGETFLADSFGMIDLKGGARGNTNGEGDFWRGPWPPAV